MEQAAVFVVGDFLAARRADWDGGFNLVFGLNDPASVTPQMADAVEVIVCADALSNDLVDALPRLKLVACFSTGYTNIDLAHLRSKGIALTTAAGVNAHDVADHALALLLSWWHRIPEADRVLKAGDWRSASPPRRSLRGRKAGVLGLGRIGAAVAQRLLSHELEVRWWGPRAKPGEPLVRLESVEALAEWADILVVCSRADLANAKQVDARVLRALGPEGVLVSVSRGFLVDESALLAALADGTIAGAALDVFEEEPTNASLWRDLANVVVTPHMAGITREAGPGMFGQLRENIRRGLAGEPLLTPAEDPIG